MNVIDNFIAIAKKEVGYKETGVNITKYNEWADKESFWFTKVQGLPWCTSFVAWCIIKLSEDYMFAPDDVCLDSKCCWSDHWMDNFKKKSRWYSKPLMGDLAFKNGHVGIVIGYNYLTDSVFTIEGNYNDGVCTVTRKAAEWLGFGRPDWDSFWEAAYERSEAAYERSEAASAKEFVINQGIYIGREDGEMHWEDNLTREEMALILYRYWRKFLKDR